MIAAFIIVVVVIILDQASKLVIVQNFSLHESIPIIEDIFYLTYVRNYGAAFGLLNNQRLFFIIITLVIILGLLFFYKQAQKEGIILQIAWGLGLGGAAGNLIDRVRLGYVIDFLDFRVWPVFNLADSAIVIAVSLFFYWAIILDGLE
ncbi:signal peptidase II [Acetohalobium arabaticum]|uniref:Lipoprotein signal peptidase n=1 Tax=Acetohalobium arabaticum (strain ATCC 49924 / DSM 5501 / Z-7288) TaxID=574087 RepID=D9QPI3_ACEAZ|nr:signal peptidase II [Acetohalobium arabaticum]ADL12424.1 lipoprotein signal peptidase [Acetohalobium arabaticum DSM 5501]